ncbi:pH-response regulator protein palA/rim20, partial [Marasmius crinis-equi]
PRTTKTEDIEIISALLDFSQDLGGNSSIHRTTDYTITLSSMSNLLALPFKKTYTINVKEVARNYLLENGDTHPDAVKSDINDWEKLRQRGVGGEAHADRINDILRYQAHLTSVLTKLPTDIQLDIPYNTVFSSSAYPITLRNLVFERAAVIFNLAALYSQLARDEDRASGDGLKRAVAFYQNASGTLQYLRIAVLPKLLFSPEDEETPLDLSTPFVQALEWLMLAQAQECFWQKAKLGMTLVLRSSGDPGADICFQHADNYKNSTISKLAASASLIFVSTCVRCDTEREPLCQTSVSIAHIQAKQHHFDAVSQYRKSREELEGSRYGSEIAYLTQALAGAKRAHDIARKGKASPAVQQDAQSLLEALQKDIARAERDNDLIYHQDVPVASSLPSIPHAAVAQMTIPKELTNPTSIVASEDMLFSELVGWGTREAIKIYYDRRKNLLQDELVTVADQARENAERTLQELNLPGALEALERPVGLPPSLLKKVEEVRLENGPVKIEAAIRDLGRMAHQNMKILDEASQLASLFAMDILDHEASEDEATREARPLDRPPSHEANLHLVEKERRYRDILKQAAESDETVQTKWDQWETNITELTWDEADLEASIPSSTLHARTSTASDKHARSLRGLLEELDRLKDDRNDIVRRAQKLAEVDNVEPRILKAAAGFERLAEVQPAMFEDIFDEELVKYDKFIKWMNELQPRQEELLDSIRIPKMLQAENALFLQSRKEDESVKERERTLQSLDLAYHKYQEIVRNLEEGIKFYNDLLARLLQLKDACKQWSNERSREVHLLSKSLQSTTIAEDDTEHVSERVPSPQAQAQQAAAPARKLSSLPPIDSSEWGFETMDLPPGPGVKKNTRH